MPNVKKKSTTTSKAPALAVAALLARLTLADLDARARKGSGDGAPVDLPPHGDILAALTVWAAEVRAALDGMVSAFARPLDMEAHAAFRRSENMFVRALGTDPEAAPFAEATEYLFRLSDALAVESRGGYVECVEDGCEAPLAAGEERCARCAERRTERATGALVRGFAAAVADLGDAPVDLWTPADRADMLGSLAAALGCNVEAARALAAEVRS